MFITVLGESKQAALYKMNEEKSIQEVKKEPGTPNRAHLQSYIQNFTREAIDAIVQVMRTTRNENLRMGAAKVIIDKSIADIKAMEITGENGEPIKLIINAGNGFIPSTVSLNATSSGSYLTGQPQIQSYGVASQSAQDNNSDNRVDKTDATT